MPFIDDRQYITSTTKSTVVDVTFETRGSADRSTVVDIVYRMAATVSAPIDVLACCAPVSADALDEQQAESLARAFAALADPIRLRLLSFITSAAGEVCACDLVEPSGRSQPTVSHHMKILVDAGLISRDKRGLWVWYRAVPERIAALRAVLG